MSHKGSPRILEWVACPFSCRTSWPRNQTGVSCISGRFFTCWAMREALVCFRWPFVYKLITNSSLKSRHYSSLNVNSCFGWNLCEPCWLFPPAVSAPYEARQPLVQPEGPSSGGPGAKPPRHQVSLIRVSDASVRLYQWETSGVWLFEAPFKEDIKLSLNADIIFLVLLLVYFLNLFILSVSSLLCVSRVLWPGFWFLI